MNKKQLRNKVKAKESIKMVERMLAASVIQESKEDNKK